MTQKIREKSSERNGVEDPSDPYHSDIQDLKAYNGFDGDSTVTSVGWTAAV